MCEYSPLFDQQKRVATETDPALCFVLGGKPSVVYLALLDPERRALCRLCLDASDGEIYCVDPDFPRYRYLLSVFGITLSSYCEAGEFSKPAK